MKLFTEWQRKAALRKKREELKQQRDQVCNALELEINASKDADEKNWLGLRQLDECSEFSDAILAIDSVEIVSRAASVHLSLSDVPVIEGETSHWETGNYGDRYIHPKTLRHFTKMVEVAEYERTKRRNELNDFWLKVFTAISAALAAVVSIINLFVSQNHTR